MRMWLIHVGRIIHPLDSSSLDVNSVVKKECFLVLEYMGLAEQRSPAVM